MFNKNSSARTAAQKSSKGSLFARLPLLLAILMLSAVFCQAQRVRDTVKVVMLVSDTLHYSNFTPQLNKENYFDKSGSVAYVTGYSVREKHNTSDGVIDPGSCMGCNWRDYWKDLSIY